MTRLGAILKNGLTQSANLLWPPVCPACEAWVPDAGMLCRTCWEGLTFIGTPQCHACGIPFEYDVGPETLCGACARGRPPYDRARAAVAYNDASKNLVLPFKHADRTDYVSTLVRLMQRPAAPLIADADIIAPVPLHWSRMLKRRFNQAALLGNRLSKGEDVRAVPDLMIRTKRTGTQGGLSASARKRNVRSAFKLRARYRARVRDAHVLIVDDVMTTGATVEACARTLLRAGAGHVDVITFARVLGDGL